MLFLRVIAWCGAEKFSLKKSCFYLYIRRNDVSNRAASATCKRYLIYPHEGLKQAEYVIEQIRTATSFSEEAFQYALYRSHYYKVEES